MEDIYKYKLAKVVYNSDLNDEQKLLWGIFLKQALPHENEAVYEAVSQSNEDLMLLTKHMASKLEEMKKR